MTYSANQDRILVNINHLAFYWGGAVLGTEPRGPLPLTSILRTFYVLFWDRVVLSCCSCPRTYLTALASGVARLQAGAHPCLASIWPSVHVFKGGLINTDYCTLKKCHTLNTHMLYLIHEPENNLRIMHSELKIFSH